MSYPPQLLSAPFVPHSESPSHSPPGNTPAHLAMFGLAGHSSADTAIKQMPHARPASQDPQPRGGEGGSKGGDCEAGGKGGDGGSEVGGVEGGGEGF